MGSPVLLRVQSCSESVNGYAIENLLNRTTSSTMRPWKTSGQLDSSVIFQLPGQINIHRLHVGNHFSSSVEVFVGQSCEMKFESLIPMWRPMSKNESIVGQNGERLGVFTAEHFEGDVIKRLWDMVKVICSQPFFRRPFGLLLFEIYGSRVDATAKTRIMSAPSTPKPSLFDELEKDTSTRNWEKKLALIQKEQRKTAFLERHSRMLTSIREARLVKREISLTSLASSSTTPPICVPVSPNISSPCAPKPMFRFISPSRQKIFLQMLRDPYSTPSKRARNDSSVTISVPPLLSSSPTAVPLRSPLRDLITEHSKVEPSHRQIKVAKPGIPSIVGKKVTHIRKTAGVSTTTTTHLPLKGVVFTIGNFNGCQYAEIMTKTVALGAVYQPSVTERTTHAIVPDELDPLVNEDSRVYKVLPLWIRVCEHMMKKVDVSVYLVNG